MQTHVIYEEETGAVRVLASASQNIDLYPGCAQIAVELEDTSQAGMKAVYSKYVVEGELVDRPALPQPDTVSYVIGESSTWLGVPDDTVVYIDGVERGVIDDGEFEFECPVIGTYLVRLEPPFPTVAEEWEVTVNED